jgi:branched-chain amino acid transport system ATP-binding protein
VSATAHSLAARDIRVYFEGVRAIDGVDLTLERGDILGLIGPNGAGKTTLVNVITGVQEPLSGSDDLDVTQWSAPRRARAGLARTFQGARLFDRLTVHENLEVGAVASGVGRRAARALTRDLLQTFSLDGVASREARALPHGLARRVGVARALSTHPRFLLLDEPAAGLDEHESADLASLLRHVRDEFELGLVVIEHDVPFIMSLSERVQVLDHGKTLAIGSPAEVTRNPEVVAAYLGEQTTEQTIA